MALIGWGQVEVGDIVLGTDCMRWQVGYLDPATRTVGMTRVDDGFRWTGTPAFSQVERVVLAAETVQQAPAVHAAAVAVVQAGVVKDLAAATIEGGWPPVPALAAMPDPGVARAHLWIFHGDPAQEIPDNQLVAHHDTLHQGQPIHVPHEHLS